jgi:hypothetical protein
MAINVSIEESFLYRRSDGSVMVMFKLDTPDAKEFLKRAMDEPPTNVHIHDIPHGGKWTVILEDSLT